MDERKNISYFQSPFLLVPTTYNNNYDIFSQFFFFYSSNKLLITGLKAHYILCGVIIRDGRKIEFNSIPIDLVFLLYIIILSLSLSQLAMR